MRRHALRSYRARQHGVTIALEWLWIALGFVLLAVLIAFTRLPWPLVLVITLVVPFGLGSVVSDLRKGEVTPLSKLYFGPYRRDQEPVAFWLSLAWNAVSLLAMIVLVGACIVDRGAQL